MRLDYVTTSKATNGLCIWTQMSKNKHTYEHSDWENK